MFFIPVSVTNEAQLIPFFSQEPLSPKFTAPTAFTTGFQQELNNMYKSFFTNSSPLMEEFFKDKFNGSFPKLAEGNNQLTSAANPAADGSGRSVLHPVIRTNVGSISPESISVKIDAATRSLTISGEETSEQGFAKFSSTRTLPTYVFENKLEEQIVSKLVTDQLTGNRVLEVTLPEEPKKAIEEKEKEQFKSEEIKIQIVGDKEDQVRRDSEMALSMMQKQLDDASEREQQSTSALPPFSPQCEAGAGLPMIPIKDQYSIRQLRDFDRRRVFIQNLTMEQARERIDQWERDHPNSLFIHDFLEGGEESKFV